MKKFGFVITNVVLMVGFSAASMDRPDRREENRQSTDRLIVAAVTGDEGDAEAALADGADINAVNDVGLTPIFVAAANGHTGVLRILQGAQYCVEDHQICSLRGALAAISHGLILDLQDALRDIGVSINTLVGGRSLMRIAALFRAHYLPEDSSIRIAYHMVGILLEHRASLDDITTHLGELRHRPKLAAAIADAIRARNAHFIEPFWLLEWRVLERNRPITIAQFLHDNL